MKLNDCVLVLIVVLSSLTLTLGQISLLKQLNFIASENQYTTQKYPLLQVPFSLENIMARSMETAMQTCQTTFKWKRWNCPSSDFLLRRSSNSLLVDREDSYVNAISMAAVLYTITKNCSSGIMAGCTSCSDGPYTSQCPDNPKAAKQLLKQHDHTTFFNDFYGKIGKHNNKAVTNLLEKSLTEQCNCAVLDATGECVKEVCRQVLKPFADIAVDIYQMYEEALQISNVPENSRIMWHNIPLDALVYIKDSPNYCEPDAVPHWNGMQGRQCSAGTNTDGKSLSKEDRTRCRHLCHECGYTVLPRKVATQTLCNCKLIWGFRVHCEMCVTTRKHYYCY